jgi:organic radical activating enzyme
MTATALVAECVADVPLFLQPLTNRDGSLGVSARHLLHLQAVAATQLPNVRVMPQMHLMIGAL